MLRRQTVEVRQSIPEETTKIKVLDRDINVNIIFKKYFKSVNSLRWITKVRENFDKTRMKIKQKKLCTIENSR